MGSKSDDILATFGLTTEDSKKYDVVKDKFDGYFVKRRNIIFERAKFHRRKQESGEAVDSFITDLYGLAEHCQFGFLHDEMIRDRIVVGLADQKLSEKLQLDADLTLEKAINSVRQSESVRSQQSVVRGQEDASQPAKVDRVHKSKPQKSLRTSLNPQLKTYKQSVGQNDVSNDVCKRCGKSPAHKRTQCPAKDAHCRKCKKKGHFQAVCLSGKVNTVVDDDSTCFLGALGSDEIDSLHTDPWKTSVSINGNSVEFKLDTGADVSVVPDFIIPKLNATLRNTRRTLTGPDGSKLKVTGVISATLKANLLESKQEIFVVRNLKTALLGRPAIEALNLVKVVNAVEESYKEYVQARHPKLFKGLGKLDGKYHIQLKDNAVPYAVNTPRRIALPLMPKVKDKLVELERQGVISKVDQPTDWCAPIVAVPKSNGDVRVCVDLTKLNDQVKRERLMLPSVDDVLSQLSGAKVFSKLDANSGFYQIELTPESALLTTFITPFGRFCYNRLPFGITSAPEYFQKRMQSVLAGVEGTVNMIDDTLVFGKDQTEHDERLEEVLRKLEEAGITLNAEKCEYSKASLTFLGHVVDASGIRPDPEKIKAIRDMEDPTNVTELRRFLGMTNQLGKFSDKIAEVSKPLRDLLSTKNSWVWESPQKESFKALKKLLSSEDVVLAHYDREAETRVSADASSYGLGAVLEQKQKDLKWKPVAYQSRSLTACEQRYAQIEKEALATTWACERFNSYLLGKTFEVQTDHKPLIYLLSSKKDLDCLPPRIQRFRMRLMKYSFNIVHVPGKNLNCADALSRAPNSEPTTVDRTLEEEGNLYVNYVFQTLPATGKRLEEIKAHLQEDEVCKQIMAYCNKGWPEKCSLKGPVKLYAPFAAELTVQNGLLLKGSRLVIPASMRLDMLDKLHAGHQGIVKCRVRARESVWWPGIGRQLEELVNECPVCRKYRRNHVEPMIASELPDYPWQKVASDQLFWKGKTYLLVVDYYSRFIEVSPLASTTSQSIIASLKTIFSRFGIPETFISDNGPNYASKDFVNFAKDYGFTHVTSSPLYAQANGEAERAVQTVKRLFDKCPDPHLALLAYRSTPLEQGYSPAQLLMSRNLRTTVPVHPCKLKPEVIAPERLSKKDSELKQRQKENYDSRHRVHDLPPLTAGDRVYLPQLKTNASVQREYGERSYIVSTPNGLVRRNKRHLNSLPKELVTEVPQSSPQSGMKAVAVAPVPSDQENVRTRSGRVVRPPQRLVAE